MKGSYILEIELKKDQNIPVGKLGNINFKKGSYFYVGSALNGLEQRINRHLRIQKKFHWHIDYLLNYSNIRKIYYKENQRKEECDISKKIGEKLPSINGFGCSDCRCNSHLFYGSNKEIGDLLKEYQIF